ncbi:hypothetical protein E1B28_001492 [Marasmius oreades]|uniref:Uncharacterized protein n=1 Tax=Marasmius oreades TaxID=181124 RepID=A0A9P7V3V4_9AGAR|nr:uncharacterized protein E1B28_001492 [Marasmius oreades]KAG7099667.1 hypothetical protein E1B28_001492 [Marasmius oreades]
MDVPHKRKVTSKLSYNQPSTSRPVSPVKALSSSPSLSTLRPKAKVNTIATPRSTKAKSVVSVSPASNISSPLLRPSSPSKTQRPITSPQAGQPRIRAIRTNFTPQVSRSTPGTPIITSVDPIDDTVTAPRYGMNAGINRSPQLSDRDGLFYSELSSNESSLLTDNQSDPPPLKKIKSKVSRVARPASAASDSLSPPLGPSYPSSKPGTPRARASSISSGVSLNSPRTKPPPITSSPAAKTNYNFYPITTATPAANPHRFASTRASPPPLSHQYQPFSSPTTRDDVNVNYDNHNHLKHRQSISTIVDPTCVPLPPHSPPASALSFSSRSSASASRSSVSAASQSSAPSHHTQHGSRDLKSGVEALVQINGFEDDENALGLTHDHVDEQESEERKVKDVAKSNRKIEDLEITNRSLLSINSVLESTRNRQAKEIRELRRKLRESRLILPPRTYRIIASNTKDEPDAEDESDDEDEQPINGSDDSAFMRVRMLINDMVESGKRALASKPEDFMVEGKGGTKVLTAEEVRFWRDSSGGTEEPTLHEGRTSPSRSAIPNLHDGDELDSEDEVAAMTLPHSDSSSSGTPLVVGTPPS